MVSEVAEFCKGMLPGMYLIYIKLKCLECGQFQYFHIIGSTVLSLCQWYNVKRKLKTFAGRGKVLMHAGSLDKNLVTCTRN